MVYITVPEIKTEGTEITNKQEGKRKNTAVTNTVISFW